MFKICLDVAAVCRAMDIACAVLIAVLLRGKTRKQLLSQAAFPCADESNQADNTADCRSSVLNELDQATCTHLLSAGSVCAADFTAGQRVDVHDTAVSQYKIINCRSHLEAITMLSANGNAAATGGAQDTHDILDALLDDILLHVSVQGCTVTKDDCVVFALASQHGSPCYTRPHWDFNWTMFPNTDGFQLWYLVDNSAAEGNMFVVKTPELREHDLPVRFVFLPDGTVQKTHHDNRHSYALGPERVEAVYSSAAACAITFAYLAMQPGDCFVFSKRTLHMSDPRPRLHGRACNRIAVQLRVVVRRPGEDTIPFWAGHLLCHCEEGWRKLALKAGDLPKGMGGRQRVKLSRFEMLSL